MVRKFLYDPRANQDEVKAHLGLDLVPIDEVDTSDYSGVLILAVAHAQFLDLDLKLSNDRVLFDVKSQLKMSDKALLI